MNRGIAAESVTVTRQIGLLPALYRHLNPLDWELATVAEVALAEALADAGIRVKQG